MLLAAWARLLGWLPTALATNLFSAVATAVACGLGAFLLARWTGGTWAALAAAVAAGGMSTVWLNATETEVYAATLALAIVTLAAADRAGRSGERRWLLLVVYLMGLAVPLHMSALVAGPAIVYAAMARDATGLRWANGAIVGGSWLIALGIGTMAVAPTVVGVGIVAGGALAFRGVGMTAGPRRHFMTTFGWVVGMAALAATGLLFLIVRAQHDPLINQGAPSTLATFADVVARRQYDVAPVWPRRAPLWLQAANVFQYADWQVALALGRTVIPTPARIIATVFFAALGIVGSLEHRRVDRRSWRVLLLLLIAGSAGVVAYLNLRAGPSFGWGILPDDATREARERDYFFVLGFWTWGLWAGYGAVVSARRLNGPSGVGVAVAALPIVLNWQAVDRRRWPDATLPRLLASALLEATPPRGVLFVGGDNDTYPLWHAQAALGIRRDVTVVTTPLLPAEWYRRELWRRHRLQAEPARLRWQGRNATSLEIARRARSLGRPVAVAVTMPGDERRAIGGAWELRGPVFVEVGDGVAPLRVDTLSTARWSATFEAWRRDRRAPPGIDPTNQLVLDVLSCPGWMIGERRHEPIVGASRSLASLCNLR